MDHFRKELGIRNSTETGVDIQLILVGALLLIITSVDALVRLNRVGALLTVEWHFENFSHE